MKRFYVIVALLFVPMLSFGQSRTAGQMVVPVGYESYDSLRFTLLCLDEALYNNIGGLPDSVKNPLLLRYLDSLSATFAGTGSDPSFPIGSLKGVTAAALDPTLYNAATWFKQRSFSALPNPPICGFDGSYPYQWRGFLWRYNDANGLNWKAAVHNNSYDANDISPYTEFPQSDSIVNATFHTLRFHNTDSVVAYGNEGRVILGHSDIQDATALLKTIAYGATYNDITTPTLFGNRSDTAKLFSATLEFAIDTTKPVDTALLNGRSIDNLPLVRLQILFKKGVNPDILHDTGWPVLPFVPFKSSADTSQPGWWKVVDTTITLSVYHTLDYDWRKEDRLANGSPSHPWKFKQIHVLLKDIPQSMKDLTQPLNLDYDGTYAHQYDNMWGLPSGSLFVDSATHPDFLVGRDTIPSLIPGTPSPSADAPLLEMRVLSTYRATVRVRSLAFEDTITDKFLYRKHAGTGDSTYSLNPDGSPSHYDDSLRAHLVGMNATLATEHHLPFEYRINDTGIPEARFGGQLGVPMFGYTDWMASEYGIHTHWREQNGSSNIFYYRRARMSMDGIPPSLYEVQNGISPSLIYPSDYVANAWSLIPGTAWDNDTNFLQRMQFAPASDTNAYRAFTSAHDGLPALLGISECAHSAHDYPKDRRMTLEWSAQTWGSIGDVAHFDTTVSRIDIYSDTIHDSTHHIYGTALFNDSVANARWFESPAGWVAHGPGLYDTVHSFRLVRHFFKDSSGYQYFLPTPTEITSSFFYSIANGATAINVAQPFVHGDPTSYGSYVCMFGNSIRVGDTTRSPGDIYDGKMDYALVHNYNFGHQYTAWNGYPESEWTLADTNDAEGNLPYYYLGYSNSWRAHREAVNRINEIYDSTHGRITPHPLRYMTWLDAYSNNRCDTPSKNVPWGGNNIIDSIYGYKLVQQDSISKYAAFLKVDSTVPVKRWSRTNGVGPYLDSTGKDNDINSYVEVGLFLDSNSTTKNYAAMVINTRLWPSNDSAEIAYYNAGVSQKRDSMKSTLGDIDVRKVYLKLDVSKTDGTFQFTSGQPQTYYVVRDLWHPDSTWLVNKDSTFAVYLKPGDAKFLYFEKGIAINAAARTGTDTGMTTAAQFCFNNGRRIAEIEHGTKDIITYTRNNKLYVAMPAAGSTFGGSPDQSKGDNIITGNEIALDTRHYCARPSICVAQNDEAVALAYWYKDSAAATLGHVAVAYRKTAGSSWDTISYTGGINYFEDTTSDLSWVTPVLTPINDTSWLVAAGNHNPIGTVAGISGMIFVVPHTGSPYFKTTPLIPLAFDIPTGPTIHYATWQTLTSRPIPDSLYPVRTAFQRSDATGHTDIFFERWSVNNLLTSPTPEPDTVVNVSQALQACDNIHPSLAMNGTVELGRWIDPTDIFGNAKFYHDNLAWETSMDYGSYSPVVRIRHEVDSPFHKNLGWGAFNEFNTGAGGFHYPQIAAESRTYNGQFAFPADSSHDWIRMVYGLASETAVECWSPNWLYYRIPETSYFPTLPQTTNNDVFWPNNGSAPRSMAWIQNSSVNVPIRVTNGYLPRIKRSIHPNILLEASIHPCDTPIVVGPKYVTLIPPSGPPVLASWNPVNLSSGDAAEAWTNPETVPNVEHTEPFAIQACDSIVIPRTSDTNGIAEVQDSLKSLSDYVMFRMRLLRKSDSSWLGTIDSMIITKTTAYWAGASLGVNPTEARYEVSCSASPDSAFVSMEVLRGDTTNSIHRYYVNVMDTVIPIPAAKHATQTRAVQSSSPLVVTVHPNPASNFVKVCVEELPEGIPVQVNVVNQMGVSVATLYNATPEAELGLCLSLDCSKLPSGVYYADLQTEGTHKAVKFSVEH